LVNEITPSGEVVHLRNTRAPFSSSNEAATVTEKKEPVQATEQPAQKEEATETPEAATPAEFKVSEEDNALLVEYFGAENAAAIVTLHETAMNSPRARPSELGKVTVVVSDRDLRTKIHQAIRRIFNSQLESSADGEGNLAITAASNQSSRPPWKHWSWKWRRRPCELGRAGWPVSPFHYLQGKQGYYGGYFLLGTHDEDEPEDLPVCWYQG
jgi:tRNA pseudouridine13 synthase